MPGTAPGLGETQGREQNKDPALWSLHSSGIKQIINNKQTIV